MRWRTIKRRISSNATGENWCNTEAQIDKVEFRWNISNFSFHEADGTNELLSATFSSKTNQKFEWQLQCRPNGNTDAKDAVAIYLCLNPCKVDKLFAKFTVSLLDKRQQVTRNGETISVYEFTSDTTLLGWKEFVKKDKEFRNKLKSNGDKLMIGCKVEFSEMKNVRTDSHHQLSKISACNLSEDLALLFEKQEFSDVILTVKGKNYHVHKQILVARSTVFAAMFKHNTTEAEKNKVIIEDLDENVMDELLRYIYTGKCQNLKKVADGLLPAADKYALDRLKIICIDKLCETLSIENAVNRLVLADLYDAKDLKIKAIKVITKKFVKIVSTPLWKNIVLSNPELASEVCQAFARRR